MKEAIGMRRFYRSNLFWSIPILSICLYPSLGLNAKAQQSETQDVSKQSIVSTPEEDCYKDLQILSQRLGIAFVLEGRPFAISQNMPVPTLNINLSREEAVKEVAAYFDYEVARQGDVYLLTKKYSNPEDLPELTQAECRNAIKKIVRIMKPFNPQFPPGTSFGSPEAQIAHLLSAEQLDKLGKDGLPVSEITASQQAEVWRLARKFYLQGIADRLEESLTYLENRNPADPVFHWQNITTVHAFGYDARSVSLNRILFVPVSDSQRISVIPSGEIIQKTGTSVINGVTVSKKDPMDPVDLSLEAKLFLDRQGKSPRIISLSEAIAALNRQDTDHTTYKVDSMFAGKHVMLVGAEKLSGPLQMRAFAAIYGLSVAHNEQGSYTLTSSAIQDAKQISDLDRVLRAAIPLPLYHAIRACVLSTNKGIQGLEGRTLLINYMDATSALRRSYMRMFRYVAEPQVKSQKDEKLALSHLGEEARLLFELAPTLRSFTDVCWLLDRPLPPYIADFDHIILTGGDYRNSEGLERFSLFLSYRDPRTGVMAKGVGFMNAIVPQ